ncbi:MAG TPA: CheR family methyltransferase [Flavobacterium sp.]
MFAGTQSPPHQKQDFHIVGVGASAGGLDSFKRFLSAIPEKSGMAYVLVQHLSPNHESILPELLAKSTPLPVHEITDDINLAPDHIYIIPENKILTAIDGVLKLNPRSSSTKPHMPIDVFFNSLAETHKSFAIGVILSGAGLDGTRGLKAIRELGGATIAQDPITAAYESMPYHAVKSNAADYVLPPEEIPGQLQHIRHAYETSHSHEDEESAMPKTDEEVFRQIIRLLRVRTGNDFTHYKQATIRRRIARRMVVCKREEPETYLSYLRSDKMEQDALFNDIVIPVTYFFRDQKVFDIIQEQVIPHLIKNKNANNLRVWCAACSTGEEAYSLAISLHEFFSHRNQDMKVQVFATDISENVITKARSGTYNRHDLENLSEAHLNTYFTKSDGIYSVNKSIRDMCVFAVHNFVKDPPFAKLDLISCRNVLIYLDATLQAKALTTFHYALKENGILVLGKSETASNAPGLFTPFVKTEKVYLRKPSPGHFEPAEITRKETTAQEKTYVLNKPVPLPPDFQKMASEILFHQYTPAGVIVNEFKDIVHFHGDTGPYLLSSPGKPNFNILKMAREGLSFELQSALLLAKKEKKRVIKNNLIVKSSHGDTLTDVEVIPLAKADETNYLVLFSPSRVTREETNEGRQEADMQRIRQLEAELEQIRRDIRSVTEEQEAAIEELQSANEELLSSSEELQSLNEEMETSTEELQANNEELISVNDELMDRQEQLTEARNFAEAIISTISQSLIILDKHFRIRSANVSFHKCFGTSEKEIEGKSLFTICKGQWQTKELRALLEDVLPKQVKFERFEIEIETPDHGTRVLLVNGRQVTREKYGEALILLAIDDVTHSKLYRGQKDFSRLLEKQVKDRTEELAHSQAFLQSILNSTNYGVASYEAIRDSENRIIDFRITYTNSEVPKYFDLKVEEVTGKTCREVYPGIFKNGTFEKLVRCMETGLNDNYEVEVNQQGKEIWLAATVSRVGNSVTVTSKNITEEKNAALHLQAINKLLANKNRELEHRILSDFSESLSSYKTGDEFFKLLLLELYQKTKMDYIFLAEAVTTEKGGFIDCIAVAAHGKIVDPFSFPLQGDACEDIIKGKVKSKTITTDIRKIYPDSEMVKKHGIDSYSGFALTDGSGKCIGVMSMMHHNEIRDTGYIESLLSIAAKRCEMELERQRNQKILEEKNAELQLNNKELESFNYIASHDLQEPLRKIQLFQSRIIEKDKKNLSPASLEYFDTMSNAADRMQKLIEALLSYSTANLSDVAFVKTDLNKMLREVKEDLADVIESRKVTIVSETLPKVIAIPTQFRQLLHNLISNGIKYSKKDEAPQIMITASQTDGQEFNGNKYYKISISDNGIGFEQQYEHKIFELFQRLHGKTDYVGTGIGLAICKKIAQNHKGFIRVVSEPGKGSTFTVYIPVKIQ